MSIIWDATVFIQACERQQCSIGQVMLERELVLKSTTREAVWEKMRAHWLVMRQAAQEALHKPIPSQGGLIGGEAKQLAQAADRPQLALGGVARSAMMYAMSVMEVNAAMGLIVAAPTAGSAGVLPGVLLSLQQAYDLEETALLEALFCAGAVGYLINQGATLSGAEGGCQAEVGSAAAMAAAATVQLLGGTPKQAFDAASIALTNLLGLVCDPVHGLVEMPCQLRNAQGAITALSAAELVLSGLAAPAPFDEMIPILYRVGQSLSPELRETALGGLATAPTFHPEETATGNRRTQGCTGCLGCR